MVLLDSNSIYGNISITYIAGKSAFKLSNRNRLTTDFANCHGYISKGDELVDREDDEGDQHGQGEVPHQPRVRVQQPRVDCVHGQGDEEKHG